MECNTWHLFKMQNWITTDTMQKKNWLQKLFIEDKIELQKISYTTNSLKQKGKPVLPNGKIKHIFCKITIHWLFVIGYYFVNI